MAINLAVEMRTLTFDVPLPGDIVTIAEGLKGTVTGVCVRDEHAVTIEVTWWDGRTRQTAWFSPYELGADQAKGQIGFINHA